MNITAGQTLSAAEVRRRALTLLVADLSAQGVPTDVLLSDLQDGLVSVPATSSAAA